jgi:hypothetical protein
MMIVAALHEAQPVPEIHQSRNPHKGAKFIGIRHNVLAGLYSWSHGRM